MVRASGSDLRRGCERRADTGQLFGAVQEEWCELRVGAVCHGLEHFRERGQFADAAGGSVEVLSGGPVEVG